MTDKPCSKCAHNRGSMCMNPKLMSRTERGVYGSDAIGWKGEWPDFARSLLMHPFGCRPWGRFFEGKDDDAAPRKYGLWARIKIFLYDLLGEVGK